MVVESLPSTNDVFVYIVLQYLVYFGPGYLLLHRRLESLPFVIKLPLYFSLGMLVVTIILSVLGIFYFWDYTLLVIGIVSYIIILIRLLLNDGQRVVGRLAVTIRNQFHFTSISSLLVFSFIVGILIYITGYLKWPQPGDAIAHGLLTNLLVINEALQTTLVPVASSLLWSSPFGFHVISANLSLAFDIFPGASIFVAAATIVALILMLIYSLTYMLTRSVVFSVLASMSGLYVSSIPNMEYWLIGYYYNGIYPCLFGYLALLVYLTTQFATRYVHGMGRATYWVISLISLTGIGLIYPPLAILPAIHFVATNIYKNRKRIRNAFVPQAFRSSPKNHPGAFTKRNLLTTPRRRLFAYISIGCLSIAIVIVASYALSTYWSSYVNNMLWKVSYGISQMILRVGQVSFQYDLSAETFIMSGLDAPLTFLTTIASILLILKGKYIYLAGSYLLFSISLLLSVWDVTANYFWFILPRRLFVFLIFFNWIIILAYARILMDHLVNRLKLTATSDKTLRYSLISYGIYALIVIPSAILLFPDVLSNAQLTEADRWVGWYSRSNTFGNDYSMMAWISQNIDPNDLIMVQNSDTFSFIYSLAVKNVTSLALGLPESQNAVQRAFDSQITWNRPELLEQFVDRYDVKYVLLLTAPESWGYRNLAILGGDGLLHHQKYSVRGYDNILSNMTFLEPIKKFGSSNLYEVIPRS